MNRKVDYLIVGQGVAGSLLAWFLHKSGKAIFIIDEFHASSASRIAAGIINPVTGKRSVKSWMIDELLPVAESTYRELEAELGVSFFSPKKIYNYFSNEEDLQFFNEKKGAAELKDFIQPLVEYQPCVETSLGGIEILRAFHLDLPLFIKEFRDWLNKRKLLQEQSFEYECLNLQNGSAIYKDIEAGKVIFCEGSMGMSNPYFNWLPFNPVKGELLTVRIKNLAAEHILKKGVFILPVGEEVFKVGSTYDWNYTDAEPTQRGKKQLCDRLERAINLPFEVLDHHAAIRPSVKDRRPLLGLHSKHPQLAIFNGMGTKGASLTPFFAIHFADFLENNIKLNREVDISRFISNFPTP